jgi:hypothetical protein
MYRHFWIFALLLVLGTPVAAQNSVRSGDDTIHFAALPTREISPEVARGKAITRSENRALLNIAVRRRQGAGDVAVRAEVRGSATNDAGQRQQLVVREVREGEAIYYLAEPRMRPGDTLRFDLEVLPEGATTAVPVRFSRRFYP